MFFFVFAYDATDELAYTEEKHKYMHILTCTAFNGQFPRKAGLTGCPLVKRSVETSFLLISWPIPPTQWTASNDLAVTVTRKAIVSRKGVDEACHTVSSSALGQHSDGFSSLIESDCNVSGSQTFSI